MRIALLILLLAVLAPPAAHAQPGGQRSPGLVSSNRCLWIFSRLPAPMGEKQLLSIAVRPENSDAFYTPASLRGLKGKVHSAAAAGLDLHVFFDQGSHRRYRLNPPPRAGRRVRGHTELPLPGDALPIALAGHTPTSFLYALVTAHAAEQILVALNRQLQEQAARDDDDQGEDSIAQAVEIELIDVAATMGAARYFVARYELSRWTIVTGIPAWIDDLADCHLAVSDSGRIDVLFTTEHKQRYEHASFEYDEWTAAREVNADDGLRMLALSWTQGQLLALGHDQSADTPSIQVLAAEGAGWIQRQNLQLHDWPNDLSTDGLAATCFGDAIAVAVLSDQRRLLFGRWPITGGAAIEPLREVSGLKPGGGSALSWRLQSIAAFAVLGALLLYVFARRGHLITREADLPAHYAVASMGRRLCGFVIDLAPVAMATMNQWVAPFTDWLNQYNELQGEGGAVPPIDDELWQGWLIACGLYTGYCTVCEVLFATTPGKLAVRCCVVDEHGRRCRAGQIVLRNVLRFVELFPLFQLWPSFILMLFSRNRQRLGDLVGRTIVVRRLSASHRPIQPPADDDGAPEDHNTTSK